MLLKLRPIKTPLKEDKWSCKILAWLTDIYSPFILTDWGRNWVESLVEDFYFFQLQMNFLNQTLDRFQVCSPRIITKKFSQAKLNCFSERKIKIFFVPICRRKVINYNFTRPNPNILLKQYFKFQTCALTSPIIKAITFTPIIHCEF